MARAKLGKICKAIETSATLVISVKAIVAACN
jgi:hypothetical protein